LAEAAAQTARQTFEESSLATSLPTVDIAASELAAGIGVLNAFVKAALDHKAKA
jgi:tyrosyl-tRNA synthetase